MNIREIIVMVGIALLFTIAINYFWSGKKSIESTGTQAGQSFIAPKSTKAAKPLQLDINFFPEKTEEQPVMTEIDTHYARFVFSSAGAVLQQLSFKQEAQGSMISTIADQKEKDEGAFLVAFNELTPYSYQLIDNVEREDSYVLSYKTSFEAADIEKKFIISKTIHKIDVMLSITPKNNRAIEPRIVFPSPYMPAIAKDDVVSALLINEQGALQKIVRTKIDSNRGWFSPSLFGAENKYFIHTLVHDDNQFVQRAYYKPLCNDLLSILEGPAVNQKNSWTLSFYLGPKSETAVAPVDKRLESAIEYSGMLAPLARLLLYLLKLLYNFLYNYGLAIIGVTALIKLILLPFSVRGEKEMKKRADFQKKLNYLQQKYKNDPDMLAQERAELIRKHGMPGMAGCLPLLLQVPIFFALSKVLSSSVELYKAPFLWIPDLSSADPYYILPVFITVSMFVQALWSDPAQRLSMLAMGLVLGAVTVNLSSGLALYLVTNALLHSAQTYLTK